MGTSTKQAEEIKDLLQILSQKDLLITRLDEYIEKANLELKKRNDDTVIS